jgi:predicted transcriptional regulator
MARKAQQLTPIMVRLPEPLRRKLARLASAGGHSMNAEIIRRLEQSVAAEEPLPHEVERVLARVEEGLKRRDRLENELLQALMRIAPDELNKVLKRAMEEDKS